MGRAWLGLFILLLPLAQGQDWRLTRSQSTTQEGASAWRYTLSPANKEARELWQRLALQYQDHLRAGYRVDLGRWRLYFLGGKLRLEGHCQTPNPACFTFGALPVEKARQDRLLMGLGTLLDQALTQAQATGGTLTLSGLFRAELRRGQAPPYPARPSGWAP
ncbi:MULTISPECIES: hypothetical protein [Thermus]|uniref:hypothetical protein n=1 Tax=Thermus brockianus TaxID=56956 RepID=UPI002FE77503